jgi:hypothetical protein
MAKKRAHRVGGKPRSHKLSQYETSLERTVALRDRLRGSDLLPLFDHMIRLAEDDYRESKKAPYASYRANRAGIELRKARRLAEKFGRDA